MIVLNKKIRKSDSRKIIKIRTINGIIKKKDKAYIVDSDTSKYQYSSSFFKNRYYAGICNEDELINYAYNESFYVPIFNHRNAAFNIKIDKFNVYRLSLTKISILDIYIFKLDLSRVIYSDIKINFNKIIQALDIYSKA